MLKVIGLVPAASEVILRPPEAVSLRLCFEAVVLLEVQWENRYILTSTIPDFSSFLDIQLCCFLARIYVCVHLFGCQNKSTCFQILVSSNIFYARARKMMPVALRPAALRRS